MNKVLEYFKNNNSHIFTKEIHVYGWQKEYDYKIISSVSKYLFEDFQVIEHIAPITNESREGIKKPKFYITVHDTGDALATHSAKFWSDAVYNEAWEEGPYKCSYQYVVGNDGIYHNIPDDEIAWHAGDSTRYDYALYDAHLEGNNPHPKVTISSDGYYEIDGKKSSILAPRAHKERGGKVLFDRVARTDEINDGGVLCKLIDGKYYIGETYYSSGYEKISNRGGNNNSIGIESCINEGTDIYLTWQRTAKLVANLLHNNNLTFDDVKQHHYFSGKNCPQTIRMNGMWEHFMELVKTEYDIINFLKEGYKIKLIPLSENVCSNGRIKADSNELQVSYRIVVSLNGKEESIDLSENL